MERNERENNYITDDTAKNLKSAVSELERCGISTGSAGSKIEKLAWFVGGDPSKIRQLQQKLNQLGVGEHLTEDGVYGKKTKEALAGIINNMTDYISSFLNNPAKMRVLDQMITLSFAVASGSSIPMENPYNGIKGSRRELQRFIWKQGAEHYLRKSGYIVGRFY